MASRSGSRRENSTSSLGSMFFIPEDHELSGTGSNISDGDVTASRGSSALLFRRRTKHPKTPHDDSLAVDHADIEEVEKPSSIVCREFYAQVRPAYDCQPMERFQRRSQYVKRFLGQCCTVITTTIPDQNTSGAKAIMEWSIRQRFTTPVAAWATRSAITQCAHAKRALKTLYGQ
ncbi:hypothetical protein MHU86_14510 [Fragilaria crotonensis]|nr:hypothetical protein MHU86_14510 [Fragilaria crotonensis]